MMQQMYSTKLFSQFYDNAEDFVADYKTCGIPAKISDESATTLFYLLYARYGNNPISNYDETQFKLKLFGLIFSAGPTWEKRIEIQDRLRGLNEAELLQGSKRILNTALNPETTPSTLGLEELTYINQQNTSNAKKSVLGAYAEL